MNKHKILGLALCLATSLVAMEDGVVPERVSPAAVVEAKPDYMKLLNDCSAGVISWFKLWETILEFTPEQCIEYLYAVDIFDAENPSNTTWRGFGAIRNNVQCNPAWTIEKIIDACNRRSGGFVHGVYVSGRFDEFTPEQFACLSESCISVLAICDSKLFTPERMAKLSVGQLEAIKWDDRHCTVKADQIAAITPEVMDQLTPETRDKIAARVERGV